MNTSDSIELAALAVSVFALFGTLAGWIVSFVQSGKAAKEAKEAGQRAERSAVAAERSAAAQELVAQSFSDYLSRQERSALSRQERSAISTDESLVAPSPSDITEQSELKPRTDGGHRGMRKLTLQTDPDPVYWTLDRHKGQRYILTILRGNAHNVRLRADNALRFDGPDGPIDQMTEGDTVSFFAVGSWQTGTPELVVTWEETDGAEREWRRVVP